MVFIDYTGLDALEEAEQESIKNLIIEYAEKLDSKLSPDARLEMNIKLYKEEGGRKKFSLNAKLDAPAQILTAEAADWDLEKTTHKIMKKIESALKATFKDIERGYQKEYE